MSDGEWRDRIRQLPVREKIDIPESGTDFQVVGGRLFKRHTRRVATAKRAQAELDEVQSHRTEELSNYVKNAGETIENWITALQDIQVYRRALGYDVPPETPPTLSNGEIPQCQHKRE